MHMKTMGITTLRHRLITSLFILTLSASCSHTTSPLPQEVSKTQGDATPAGAVVPFPPGSYRYTCDGFNWIPNQIGKHLTARCIKRNEDRMYTALDLTGCRDDISNMDGTLSCSKGDSDPPKGSYRATTRLIVMANGRISSAESLAGNGQWVRSSHPGFCGYGQDLANVDGTLTCH